MVGKDVFLYTNLSSKNPREGISKKVTLKGNGLQEFLLTCSNPDEDNNETSTTPATCNFGQVVYLKNAPEYTAAQKIKAKTYDVVEGECSAFSVKFGSYSDGWSTDCEGVMNIQIDMDASCEGQSITIQVNGDMMSEYQK